MGIRYVLFRLAFEFRKKTGLLACKFPTQIPPISLPSKQEWLQDRGQFLFKAKTDLRFPLNPNSKLAEKFKQFERGHILFFSSSYEQLAKDDPWKTHPKTGYQYPTAHWTKIADFAPEAGDIKYVWEKARFSYILSIIRHDYHFDIDHSEIVLQEILDFIEHNPINQGPQYRCSQEISIRVLNWIFALYYYTESSALTDGRWQKIITSIYWQVHHIYHNIHFSRIAVRNNHALSETLCLYLMGVLFPNIPDFLNWKEKGKKWFEEEIAYQVYPDGTFLQFSMNYHRVVVQLLTYAIQLANNNGERWASEVYERANKSLAFLQTCMEPSTGELPNYGMNDGALFFPLGDTPFRDYRPQLQALEWVLSKQIDGESILEDSFWFGAPKENRKKEVNPREGWQQFKEGGYYMLRESKTLSFLRCGSHKDRPHQADNLHLDIWHQGENIFRDAGSYQYNTGEKWIQYFNGTESHNTIMVDGKDQMLKGTRFIWFFWSQAGKVAVSEEKQAYIFEGNIHAFRQIDAAIIHTRKVKKYKNKPHWVITDTISGKKNQELRQLWHPHPDWLSRIQMSCKDDKGKVVTLTQEEGWYSTKYGIKQTVPQWSFYTTGNQLTTEIILS